MTALPAPAPRTSSGTPSSLSARVPWYLSPLDAPRPVLLRGAAALLRAHVTVPTASTPAIPHPRAALAWAADALAVADALDAWAAGRDAAAPVVPVPESVLDARGEPAGPRAWVLLGLTCLERGSAVAALEAIAAALELARCEPAAVGTVAAVLVTSLAAARGCDAARIADELRGGLAR